MSKTNKFDNQHLRNLSAYGRQVDAVYAAAVKEAARLGVSIRDFNPDRLFSFADYPITRKRIEKLLDALESGLSAVIVNGVRSEWTLANNKNSELARQVFGDNVGKLSQAQYRRYFSTNGAARDAFLERKVSGLNLSDRVWRYTEQFKAEIELGLDIGIRNGRSAEDLQRDLKEYLRHPDKLFRRVRDEHGLLQLSQRAAAYHPGRGVYRSSYKNARRLAATETNIAYRTADYSRWQQLDFVVGIRVVLSNNHTLLGADGKPHAFTDICDKLSAPHGSENTSGRGCYPKDFKFTGWHPHCRCHAETILKTPDELMADNERIMKGEEPVSKSVNTVKDVPKEFKTWLEDNKERAKRSISAPYFITDNRKYLPKDYLNLYALKTPYATYAEYEAAMKYNKAHAGFTSEQAANNRELSQALPVMQGKIMNFTEADRGQANPHFTDEDAAEMGFYHNCQTCTIAYELRRRGFKVEAAPNPVVSGYKSYRTFEQFCARNGVSWEQRFLEQDGSPVKYITSKTLKTDTPSIKLAFIEEKTIEQGRYEVYCAWKRGGAHVFIVERQKNGELLWFDPQSARRGNSFDDNLKQMKLDKIGIIRIDDKIINPKFAERLIKAIE